LPSQSPDGIPTDFFLWVCVKDTACASEVQTPEELQQHIENAFEATWNSPHIFLCCALVIKKMG
jgi:hypothetical protein